MFSFSYCTYVHLAFWTMEYVELVICNLVTKPRFRVVHHPVVASMPSVSHYRRLTKSSPFLPPSLPSDWHAHQRRSAWASMSHERPCVVLLLFTLRLSIRVAHDSSVRGPRPPMRLLKKHPPMLSLLACSSKKN